MTFETYKEEFTKKALVSGYSSENIQKCLIYAETLFSSNLPVIYDITHLAALVGYNTDYLKRVAVNSRRFYRTFQVPKKKKGVRLISEPLPSLKEIQVWILENVLYRIVASRFAKAYIRNLSLRNNVSYHKKKDVVLTLDILDFFPSIKLEHVQQIFLSFGYSLQVANLLSKLCTLDSALPQGAPTSPYLSNLYLRNFDEKISNYCINNKIHYTRYADDLSFSGNFDVEALKLQINKYLQVIQMRLHPEKQKLMHKTQRQIVTGVVVNDKINLPREKRKQIRQSIYYIKKYGLQNHISKQNIDKGNYLLHLLGKINFVLFLQPENKEFLDYRSFIHSLINQENQ